MRPILRGVRRERFYVPNLEGEMSTRFTPHHKRLHKRPAAALNADNDSGVVCLDGCIIRPGPEACCKHSTSARLDITTFVM